ncbi:hypothetical protein H4S01_006457, partial [Coemansia sp. RSA 2610]
MDRQAAEYLQVDKKGRKKGQQEFNANVTEREASNQLLKAFNRAHDAQAGDANAFYASSKSKNEINTFSIAHFWGDVSYTVDDFVEKNLDQLSSDFVSVFRGDGSTENPGTDNGFIAGLFSSKTLATEAHPKDDRAVLQAQAPSVPMRAPSMMRPKTAGTSRIAKVACVATQFQRALNEMIMSLDDTLPWFVLCIKPNEQARPRSADVRRIQAQAGWFGLEHVAKRKAAEFAAVLAIADFCQRYQTVIDQYVADSASAGDDYSACLALKTALQLSDADMVLGKTKVFLSYAAWRRVDDPVRAIERMNVGEKAARTPQHDGDMAAYADPMDASATSYGDQSEAHLMLNAQPPGKNSFSDASLGAASGAQHVRALKGRMFGGGDVRSYYSDDDGYQDMGARDGASEIMSERG